MDMIPLSSILVGDRTRKDMGDIGGLSESMGEVGMLQPILLDSGRHLLAGRRRMLAAEKLGWEQVPVVIAGNFKEAIHRLKAERDENTCRKEFTKSELGELSARLLEMEKPAADQRQQSTQKSGNQNLPNNPGAGTVPAPEKGRARDKVGKALGVSGKTAEKAAAVVTAAKDDPAAFGDLPALMDSKGVKAAYAELKKRKGKSAGPKLCDRCDRVGSPSCSKCIAKFAAAKSRGKSLKEQVADAADDAEPEPDPTVEEQMKAKNAELESWCRDLMTFAGTMPDDPWLQDLNRREGAMQKIKGVCETIRSAKCCSLCPKCEGAGCRHCHKTGRITKYAKDQLG